MRQVEPYKRLILILPGLIGGEDEPPAQLAALSPFADRMDVGRVELDEGADVPELAELGLALGEAISQGAITVAALGAEPPERAVRFHLSLMSLDDEGRVQTSSTPGPGEVEALMAAAARLETDRLRLVSGPEFDHALVWEDGSIDLGAIRPADATGKPLDEVWPQGDGEKMLRRLIADGLELLSGHEINRRRADEGLPLIHLLWPWGQGLGVSLPNLPLRRGEPMRMASPSLRRRGLSRLTRVQTAPLSLFRPGLGFSGPGLLDWLDGADAQLVALDGFARIRTRGREDHLRRFAELVSEELLGPWLARQAGRPYRVTVISAGARKVPSSTDLSLFTPSGTGPFLMATLDPGTLQSNGLPFDARVQDDRRLGTLRLDEAVRRGLEG